MHSTGTGPTLANVSVFISGTSDLAAVFSDVGLTLPMSNPFACMDGAYDVYTAEDVYVVFGVGLPIYESGQVQTFREYQAPYDFPP